MKHNAITQQLEIEHIKKASLIKLINEAFLLYQ